MIVTLIRGTQLLSGKRLASRAILRILSRDTNGCQFIIRIIGRNRAALFAGRVMRDRLGRVSIIDASARLLE